MTFRRHRTSVEEATHTRVRLTFYSHAGDGFSGVVEGAHPEFGEVVSVNHSKSLGNAAGQFSIMVKKPQQRASIGGGVDIPGIGDPNSWLDLWQDPEGTWVLIEWILDGEPIDGMLGIIDVVNENLSFSGLGTRSETYTITGSCWGKIFEQTVAFTNPYDNSPSLGYIARFQRLSGKIEGPPGNFVEGLIEAFLGNYENNTQGWLTPAGLGTGTGFYNYLQRRIGCRNVAVDGYNVDASLLGVDNDGKNLWSLLQQFANPLLNEMFCDFAPGPDAPSDALSRLVPTITLRRKPFKRHRDRARWDTLPTHVLSRADVKGRALAKGGPAQRYNYWIIDVMGKTGVEMQSILQERGDNPGLPGSIPIWNLASVEKHGFRMWQGSTTYMPMGALNGEPGTMPEGDFIAVAGRWLKSCHDWHAAAPMELSGTINLSRVRPQIRIGHRVIEERDGGDVTYYVEAVTHQWTYGSAGETQITVTRGERDGEELLDVVYRELESRVSISRANVTVDASLDFDGEGLTGEGDNRDLVAEGGRNTYSGSPAFQRSIAEIDDWLSPEEVDIERVFNGVFGLAPTDPTQSAEPPEGPETFDAEALEAGAPIPASDDVDFYGDDPLAGIGEDL